MSMRLLLVDNHDSFTYNLFQMLAQITGSAPHVVYNDAPWATVEALAYDAVVLSPGPGRPEVPRDFGLCQRLIETTQAPLLGVCLGHQGVGVAWGARVSAAPQVMHGRASAVYHDDDPLFAGLPSPFEAVRYHSLAVDGLAAPLQRIAWCTDGVVMGLRHRDLPQWGVQFHPESICTEHGAALLRNFVELARQRPRGVPPRGHPRWPEVRAHRARTDKAPTHTLQTRRLPEMPDPEAVFAALYAHQEDAFWLDSSQTSEGPCFSFMGAGARGSGRRLTHRVGATEEGLFQRLRRGLAGMRVDASAAPFPFVGGYVGYIGYEVKAECGGARAHPASTPDAAFTFVDRFIAFDHEAKVAYLAAVTPMARPADAESWFEVTAAAVDRAQRPPANPLGATGPLRLHRGGTYRDDIDRCLAEIRRGETYEVCLTTRMEAETAVDPFDFYRVLRRGNPAPYAAFLRFGTLAIASSSPERFLRVEANGAVEAKPIKGTRPRGATPSEDLRLAQALSTSVKDRAENLMITDLLRNDLGRTCAVGSVSVPALMRVESFATVHQLVSTVRGRLRPDVDALDCVQAAFPGGSMTGAPKQRTMEIIDTLEGSARGVYSGALGYFGLDGAADLNVVIRTAVFTPGKVQIGVGGAIVALSEPDDEIAELLLKGRALAEALGSPLPAVAKRPSARAAAESAEGADGSAESAP